MTIILPVSMATPSHIYTSVHIHTAVLAGALNTCIQWFMILTPHPHTASGRSHVRVHVYSDNLLTVGMSH